MTALFHIARDALAVVGVIALLLALLIDRGNT